MTCVAACPVAQVFHLEDDVVGNNIVVNQGARSRG